MKLTKKRAIELHRQLWDWLAKNPGKDKNQWPEWQWNGGEFMEVEFECFLCEYMVEGVLGCDDGCPVEWPGGKCASWNYTTRKCEGLWAE